MTVLRRPLPPCGATCSQPNAGKMPAFLNDVAGTNCDTLIQSNGHTSLIIRNVQTEGT
jgi:hypothetical protein